MLHPNNAKRNKESFDKCPNKLIFPPNRHSSPELSY